MTRHNTGLFVILSLVLFLPSSLAQAVSVEGQIATFAWEPATGPVAGYGVWITWDGVAPGVDPDQIVTEPSVTVQGSYGQSCSIQVAAFDSAGHWGGMSPASDVVVFVPPISTLAVDGDLTLSDALVALEDDDAQLCMSMVGQVKQLLDVTPLESETTEDGWFGLDQLVVGSPDEVSTVRLLEVANLDLSEDLGPVYLFGLGNGEPCARDGDVGLRIHPGSTLILGGLDLYAFDGQECVHINSMFPGTGEDPNAIDYDEGTILLYGDLDEDDVDDPDDNCLIAENADQRDSDGDGYGTACDADYNADGYVDAADFEIFRSGFGGEDGDPDFLDAADHNGDGGVGIADYTAHQQLSGAAPGPSGLPCAGVAPCWAP